MDTRVRAVQRGFSNTGRLLFPTSKLTSRPASSAASEPGSEVSSMLGSGDDGFST